jgi:hypothetical protein
MTLRKKVYAFAASLVVIVAWFSTSAALRARASAQENGPVYSLEGAWYGTTTVLGTPTPTLDTFSSDAQRHGVEGTFLCTIPGTQVVASVLKVTPAGHGNWVRIATNKYAYTAVRAVYTEEGGETFIGWAKFWGTITATSGNELNGTINVMYYMADGTPMLSQPLTGTLERQRIEIDFEQ